MIRTLLLLSVTLVLSSGIRQAAKPVTSKQAKPSSLQFCVDQRVETFYLVMMLTGEYDVLISRHPSSYKSAATKKFARYKDHRAVQFARHLALQGFGLDYAANWLLQYSAAPDFQKS